MSGHGSAPRSSASSEPAAEVTISPDGELSFVWDDRLQPLVELGQVSIRRASRVEPEGALWFADLAPAGGPRLGPFPLRRQALAAERDWLARHLPLES